jgi:protein ImuB
MIVCILLEQEEVLPDALLEELLRAAPRVTAGAGRLWLDVRGLQVAEVCGPLGSRLAEAGVVARFGAAGRPMVAEVAARLAEAGGRVEVPAGGEREFLAPVALADLGVTEPLLGWLADVGIERCGELAGVTREAVEVRFGGEAVQWWEWSRGRDERRLFVAVPPERPQASIDFVDYVVTDPERLIFTANALLGGVCERMVASGSHARRLRLRLPLANGQVWERTLKTARPTADRPAWLRLARALLERLTVPDSVAGMSIEVEATEAASAVQGDLFDTGFATASAVEAAVGRVLEDQGPVAQKPVSSGHPLAEVRSGYRELSVGEALGVRNGDARGHGAAAESADPAPAAGPERAAVPSVEEPVGLTLQLLDEPRQVVVETVRRRDHQLPVRYRDGQWHAIVNAAGPDRISGGQWDESYAREYFRAVTSEGTLVWLFRDAGRERWYLHGWWD